MRPLSFHRSAFVAIILFAFSGNAESDLRDPFFGEAIFHAHQGEYFEALERLDSELSQHYQIDERSLDTLFSHIDQAEFSVGDFELRYRMHSRAGRAIKAVLEGDVEESVRADAAFRLARIHFQKDQPSEALRVLEAIKRPIPESLRDEAEFLRANVLLALHRPAEAVEVLRGLQDSDELTGFSAYNLGVALLENGLPEAAGSNSIAQVECEPETARPARFETSPISFSARCSSRAANSSWPRRPSTACASRVPSLIKLS